MKNRLNPLDSKKRQAMLSSAALLRVVGGNIRNGSTKQIVHPTTVVKVKVGLWKTEDKTFHNVKDSLVESPEDAQVLRTLNKSFFDEVSEFIVKNPDNEYARKIANTLSKGENIA